MSKYVVQKFDRSTFMVVDLDDQREICVCNNYDEREDAEKRAKEIARCLNLQNSTFYQIID